MFINMYMHTYRLEYLTCKHEYRRIHRSIMYKYIKALKAHVYLNIHENTRIHTELCDGFLEPF